jgi:metallo-beta-lactamase class B
MKKYCCSFLLLVTSAITLINATGQVVKEPAEFTTKEWVQPYQPFRIAGNLYYVGTYDLAVYLIATDKGNILINTGLASSLSLIQQNIKTLGFKFEDIKILLTTQVHFDHLGAMAAIKKMTGAKFYADAADADVLKSGGATDYELEKYGVSFEPVQPDSLLKNESNIELGNTKITLLHHPGHTKGSCSYMLEVKDEKRSYTVLIANIPSIIIDGKFSQVKNYPAIEKDYAYTLKAMKKLKFDIWVASHASQFGLHKKHKPGDTYNPLIFGNKKEYLAAIAKWETVYKEKQ